MRIHLAGILCTVAYTYLAFLSRELIHVNVVLFLVTMSLAWCGTIYAYLCIKNENKSRHILLPIVVWAIMFRLIATFGEPVLEDDYFRYLWDGYTFANSGNPYDTPPVKYFDDESIPPKFQDILDNINYPDIPTIYGPVSQYAFLLSYWCNPGELLPLKLILLIADLITLFLLLKMVGQSKIILYAWCPLLIKETSFTAHIDSLGVLFLVSAIYCFRQRSALTTGLFLALGVGVKILAILIVPFLLLKSPLKTWLVFIICVTVLYLPFLCMEGRAGFETTLAFLSDWEFNSSVYALIAELLSADAAKKILPVLFCFFYAFCLHRYIFARKNSNGKTPTIPRGDLIYGIFFLLSPVVNPWYLLWLLPFVVIFVSYWGIMALVAVSLSYIHGLTVPGLDLPPYHHPWWLRPLEFGLVGIAAVRHWRKEKKPGVKIPE